MASGASPEADAITLMRRVSLDLTGLPPETAQIANFIGRFGAQAYERWVDHLLGQPAYGERWGRHWLDLARYADSDGYEKDWVRPWSWRWRNWVIDAINRDMPFDQFTREQQDAFAIASVTRAKAATDSGALATSAPATAQPAPAKPTTTAARISTCKLRRLRHVPMIAVGTMTASEVPLATTGDSPSTNIMTGTMMTPPPMPSSPARNPVKRPSTTS